MTIRPEERDTIEAIVAIFETGKLPSAAAYGTATVLDDGAGVSFGKHQAQAKSGSLHAVLKGYYDRGGQLGTLALDQALAVATSSIGVEPGMVSPPVRELLTLLRATGADPRMQQAQRDVFDTRYWQPSLSYSRGLGLVLPLSQLVIYDTWIQSGDRRVDLLRGEFPQKPPVRGGPERAWTEALLRARGDWLARSERVAVRRSTYRIDAMLDLVAQERWALERPLTVRGVTLS